MTTTTSEPGTPGTDSGHYVSVTGIERKSWALTAVLVLGSLFFHSATVTAGAALGALLALLNFKWLCGFAGRLIRNRRPPNWLAFLYAIKYLVMGLAIFTVLKYDLVNVFAILAGVSVIFVAICWEGAAHQTRMREGEDHAAKL
jgi:hypothetical protein